MSKITTLSVSALLILSFAAHAHASAFLGKITSTLSGEVVSLLLSAALALGAGIAGILFARVAKTLRETGEFLATLGIALEDKKTPAMNSPLSLKKPKISSRLGNKSIPTRGGHSAAPLKKT